MKKNKKSVTNYSTDKINSAKISQKISSLLEDAMPKNILGMLSMMEDNDNSLLIYKRWRLEVVEKNNYNIIDTFSKTVVFKNVSLLVSALHIVYHLHKPIKDQCPRFNLIYALDQEYFRCLEDIKFFKKKIKTNDTDRFLLFSTRLEDSYHKLGQIKTQLSKIY